MILDLSLLENSLEKLEKDIQEASEMSDTCTGEWCAAVEDVIDELGNALFSIIEPKWADESDLIKIKTLKRRLHDLYAKYKGVFWLFIATGGCKYMMHILLTNPHYIII